METSELKKLKTFEDFYEKADDATRQEYDNSPGRTPDEVAYKKLKLIIRVTAGKYRADYSDNTQKKWFPVFILSSGFGFAGSACGCDRTDATVGSRLCFETKEKSDYIATQFLPLYEDLITK